MFVLGTAGHIDHGKSSLIRALTGIDPDRLPEEKQRGMTIDLGFAWLNLPNGDSLGIVDVPGHERFVRNMVAGAGGVNAVMLVIAADDGWMPQTQEHFDIIRLLDIKHGLVALTKTDLVDNDWVELVAADIKSKLKGSFLEEVPIVPVSSETGAGIPDIVTALTQLSAELSTVEDIGKSRLFIDRAFLLTGIGVVVTGTSRGGGFSIDHDSYHFPSGEKVRIRSMQAHDKKVDRVPAGSRAAFNLTGMDRSTVKRGEVITSFPYRSETVFAAVMIRILDDAVVSAKEGRQALMIHGTTELGIIMRPFPEKGIKPGKTGLAIIKASSPAALFVGDNFILRLPTPQVTIGGGKVLDILDEYPRRRDLVSLEEALMMRHEGGLKEFVITELAKRLFSVADDLLFYSIYSQEAIDEVVSKLIDEDQVVLFQNRLALGASLKALSEQTVRELDKTHRNKSWLPGMTSDEIAKRIKLKPGEQFSLLLRYFERSGKVARSSQYYHHPDFKPQLDDRMKKQADDIMSAVSAAGHSYLTFEELETNFPDCRKTVNFLRSQQKIKVVESKFIIPPNYWNDIIVWLEEMLEQDPITLAQFRDRFQTTRKYALLVLEYLDRCNVTRRDGDVRIKGPSFDERHTI